MAQELKELEDEPGVVTDYASLLRAQLEYKVGVESYRYRFGKENLASPGRQCSSKPPDRYDASYP